MKRKLAYFLALMLLVPLASCSSDKKKDDPDYVKFVEGQYEGTITAAIDQGTPMPPAPAEIEISRQSADSKKVTITLLDFTINNTSIGDVEIKEIAVSKEGNNYILSGNYKVNLSSIGLGEAQIHVFNTSRITPDKDCDLKMRISISGLISLQVDARFRGTIKTNEPD